ncbi:MAG: ribonuclease HII [Armatimonadetes bacterium]|nr:ribonuclease HII [Armatimonadota bacterium]
MQRAPEWFAGADEAGRGPLAGPLVAAAVVLPPTVDLPLVNDSKLLTHEQRESAYDCILQQAVSIGVAAVPSYIVDRLNPHHSSLLAMKQAICQLPMQPRGVLIDGKYTISSLKISQKAVIDGDATYLEIAAASIVAKVIRDRIMLDYDRLYPNYGFSRHKGYGTNLHKQALISYGPAPIHRNYLPVIEARNRQSCLIQDK